MLVGDGPAELTVLVEQVGDVDGTGDGAGGTLVSLARLEHGAQQHGDIGALTVAASQ